MKILVISDTHGDLFTLQKVMDKNAAIDVAFFLGDGIKEFEKIQKQYPNILFLGVRGNCDYASNAPIENIVKLKQNIFFYTHGNTYNVKENLYKLFITAKKMDANIVLFGHTHKPFYQTKEGIHLFNPGSLSMPRNSFASYGIITISSTECSFEILPIHKEDEKATHCIFKFPYLNQKVKCVE